MSKLDKEKISIAVDENGAVVVAIKDKGVYVVDAALWQNYLDMPGLIKYLETQLKNKDLEEFLQEL